MDKSDRAHLDRVLRYVLACVAIELALVAVAHLAPALATLFKPLYLIVPALFAYPIWHAARRRKGGDRRHSDRRDAPEK